MMSSHAARSPNSSSVTPGPRLSCPLDILAPAASPHLHSHNSFQSDKFVSRCHVLGRLPECRHGYNVRIRYNVPMDKLVESDILSLQDT